MLIEQILKTKGGTVTTIRADQTLRDVSAVLDDARIGAVVAVDHGGSVIGVLSERDIVRHVARQGEAALSLAAGDAMTRDVITANRNETVDACLSRMTDRRVRHLPVMSDGALHGIVSIGDLVKWKIAAAEAEADSLKAYVASG